MNRLLRILSVCEDACAAGATLLFVAITVAICAEVLLRYGFNRPIAWVVELSEYALLWITFLGASYVLRHGGHVRVDILLQYLSPAALRVCGMVSAASCALTSLVIFAFGIDVPAWIVLIVIPIGSLLLLLRFARLFLEYRSRARDFGAEPSH